MSEPPSPIIPPVTATSFYQSTMTTTLHRNRNNTSCNVNFMDESLEAQQHSCSNYRFGEVTTPFRNHRDPEELQDLRELERTKRHLVDKNAELNYQIQTSEDDNNSLRQHCQYLEGTLKSVQHKLKDKERLDAEIAELRCMLDNEHEEKEKAVAKICSVENENITLTTRLKDLQTELKNCQEEAEHLTLREATLLKEKNVEAAVFTNMVQDYEEKLSNEAKAAEHLKKHNEVLQDDKVHLEEEMFFMREKLATISIESMPEANNATEEYDIQVNSRINNSKIPWSTSVILSPFQSNLSNMSVQDTPQSIHSEIQMMGDNDGSLPFCEKSEEGFLSPSLSPEETLFLPRMKGDASSLSLLTNILNLMRDRQGQDTPLSKEFDDEKTTALYSHFLNHHDELLKLEKELQNVLKKTQIRQSPASGKNTSRKSSSSSRRTSRNSLGNRSPVVSEVNESLSSVQTSLPNTSRTPGPHVSTLISKFEHSSPFLSSPASEGKTNSVDKDPEIVSDLLESKGSKLSLDYDYLKDSKILSKSKLVKTESVGDRLNNNSDFIPNKQDNSEVPDNTSEDASDDLRTSLPHSCYVSDVLDSGFEQDNGYPLVVTGTQPMHKSDRTFVDGETETMGLPGDIEDKGILLCDGLDEADSDSQTGYERVLTPLRRKLVIKCNTPSSVGSSQLEIDVDVASDIYMENSQLMKLMKNVREHEDRFIVVQKQLTEAQDKNDSNISLLTKIYRLIIQASKDIFRWTEAVRKEWLSAVPAGREDEGATAPLRTPDPLDDGPLTTTHSREEIESLIHTRCDLGCHVSHDDLVKDYVNPENLAIELERELLALKLHVARSHALLHHYQSSSLHGSRSEVSTPPAAAYIPHVQGVEAGVEADFCGPTCVPRPCDSTATQTPASPISASPECEASAGEEEAFGSLSNDGKGNDPLQDDHRPLTPQHRPLYQRMSVSEEEVEEENSCHHMAVSSDHVIYTPKPTYDQLDQYSVRPKTNEEKQRRYGVPALSRINPQIGGGRIRDGSSDSEEDQTEERPRPIRVNKRYQRCYSDPIIVVPLSPPSSLDMEEEEEEDLVSKVLPGEEEAEAKEEESELPSTPESGPSSALAPSETYPSTSSLVTFNIEEDDAPTKRLQLPVVIVPATTTTSTITVVPSTTTTSTIDVVPSTDNNNGLQPTSLPAVAKNEELNDLSEKRRPSSTTEDPVFPSLHDIHLRAIGVSVHDSKPNENLSAQEIENKFKQLSLAFKTDRLTLRQRLDVQQRQRDIAEANFERELDQLRNSILTLHEDCIDMELVDAVMQVRKHVDVLTNSSSSLLSASEVWGAVQQEWRVSRALEVLLLHVENVNRLYEHDHQELEEMRKLLTEHQIELPVPPGSASSNQSSVADAAMASRRIRAISLVGLSKQSQESGNRRISLGPGTSKTALNNFIGSRSSKRRASLMPDLRPFHHELAAVAAAAVAANANASSQEKTDDKAHSNNGMLSNSITEEGSESGDDGTDSGHQDSNDSPSPTSLRRLTHFPLYGQSLQDPDPRSYEDRNASLLHSSSTESHISNPAANLVPQPQNWVMHNMEELIGLLREGQWPYTSQQTLRGAFTSFLLMLAIFYVIVATSSANNELPEPYYPDWTITVRHLGIPPT